MNEQVLERMLSEGKITAEEILRQTAVDKVDVISEMLLRYVPYDEVRRALYERIGGAPLGEFEILRTAYFKYCARLSGRYSELSWRLHFKPPASRSHHPQEYDHESVPFAP